MLQKIVAVIFMLFVVCFIAIVIEESFLGGRRRRKLERLLRAKAETASRERAGEEDRP
jgi:hypothetical protein